MPVYVRDVVCNTEIIRVMCIRSVVNDSLFVKAYKTSVVCKLNLCSKNLGIHSIQFTWREVHGVSASGTLLTLFSLLLSFSSPLV